jgi:hypothetical protein
MPYSLEEMAAHFQSAAVRCEPELAAVVSTVVETAAVLARGYIGHPHEDWAPLSDATVFGFRHRNGRYIMGKEELGFGGAESPLLRRGDLRESIGAEADGLIGEVGSSSKIALWQELGTPNAEYPIPSSPPRSFLAKSLIEAAEGLEALIGPVIISLLVPGGGR